MRKKKPTKEDMFREAMKQFWDSNKDAQDILNLILVVTRVMAFGSGLIWTQIVAIIEEVTKEQVGLMLFNGDGTSYKVGSAI